RARLRRFIALICFTELVGLAALPAELADPEGLGANTIRGNGHTLTVPPGFETELAGGPQLLDRPITVDFDEQGRLSFADSSSNSKSSRSSASAGKCLGRSCRSTGCRARSVAHTVEVEPGEGVGDPDEVLEVLDVLRLERIGQRLCVEGVDG